ncbi:hypothetical protein [Haloarcula sediminis]|uniref:hypothetical protein n=1 Tax=Haloarcula sediminis TaxID=3111777 RepID=UPI002D76F6F4|nr:hypothetical protein [Haloarcula sp. CK38]
MTETEQVKAALAALADGETRRSPPEASGGQAVKDRPEPTDYRVVIERAVTATEDVDAAAAFVESVGLDRLERAVKRAEREVSGLADDGREALATFEEYRVAAGGPVDG